MAGQQRRGSRDRGERLRAAAVWLQEQRARRGMTARELASLLGVAPQVVSNWETAKSVVSDDMADELARVFDLSVLVVRRGLSLWVPEEGGGLRAPSVEELIEEDPLLTAQDKNDLVVYLRTLRAVRRAGRLAERGPSTEPAQNAG
jgi:transcriptional regulator with XRE-family HTH domain